MFKGSQVHQARSAGTEPSARIKVNEPMIAWADIILVMEKKHLQPLQEKFPHVMPHKKIVVLDIEDNYIFNDPELVEILEVALQDYL